MLELMIDLRRDRDVPYYVQLYQHIRDEIKYGHLPAGTRLPAIRQLSEHLHISRNTVEAAYMQLTAEGYTESRARSGLYVVELEQDYLLSEQQAGTEQMKAQVSDPASLNRPDTASEIRIDFRNGSTDMRYFPYSVWNRISLETMQANTKALTREGDPQGEYGLRYQLASYLRYSRGVKCRPEQIVMGVGIQQLTTLLCQLIGGDHREVAMEEPGYNGVKSAFVHQNYRITPIVLQEDGIDVEAVKRSEAKLVFVTPSHQFPLGMIMSVNKRLKLLQWAAEQQAIIIEDDYDSEFRYQGCLIPALQGLDKTDSVVYMGTFSKALLYGISMSYMVLPERFVPIFRERVCELEPTVSTIHTHTLERFMAEGHWEKHLRKMKKVYQKKHALLVECIHRYFGKQASVIGHRSGLHVVLEVHSDYTEEELIKLAANQGVRVYGTSRFWMNSDHCTAIRLLIGFGGLTEQEIEEGVRLLYEAWFET
ncbi:PLP-dependent aminotransferase family protein [Paenibacillus arenosi]|uniref:PLP-dependent aminotransferase family protein n=1 Tax=Paenibacillus arenosi TaxID=2774142 RepID=A0ABR9AVA6_9BACL|nr:PLP-dependent aminotransferase family protein [Paenibacillus arenosi]MBD8498061.1 PLP-dependent aminotransferase family protein [Paenibacillus arenosi]